MGIKWARVHSVNSDFSNCTFLLKTCKWNVHVECLASQRENSNKLKIQRLQ